MAKSQRMSRGFNRLALFLAAMPLVIGGTLSVWSVQEARTLGVLGGATWRHWYGDCSS
jgi:hypothetical protein